MNEASRPTRLVALGSEAPRDRVPLPGIHPAGYASPAQFLEPPDGEDLATLSQLAAQVLQDPLAMRQLGDRVVELMQQDLRLQRERSRGYGRRW